jgi:hypothetical protein
MSPVAIADELVQTDAERACLAALRAATRETNGPMERHCVRQFLMSEKLAEQNALRVDREVLLCAALLHDIGLFPSVATKDVYVTDGRHCAERTLAPFGWQPERLARCLDAIEQHHELRSRWDWGAEVELIRRTDLVDVSRGLFSFGLPRDWLADLFRRVPRAGLYRMLAHEVGRMARDRPSTLPRIFRPRSEHAA